MSVTFNSSQLNVGFELLQTTDLMLHLLQQRLQQLCLLGQGRLLAWLGRSTFLFSVYLC